MTEVRQTSDLGGEVKAGSFMGGEVKPERPVVPQSIHTVGAGEHRDVPVPRHPGLPVPVSHRVEVTPREAPAAPPVDPIEAQRIETASGMTRSVLTRGVVSSAELAHAQNTPHWRSSDGGAELNNRVCGRKVHDSESIDDALTRGPYSIFPVLRERAGEKMDASAKLPPAVQEDRMGSSFLVVADFADIRGLSRLPNRTANEDLWIDRIPPETIRGLVVPEQVLHVVEPGASEHGMPVLPVGSKQQDFTWTVPFAAPIRTTLTVPDYHNGLQGIIDGSAKLIQAGKEVFVHAVRVPTNADIQARMQRTQAR